MWLLEIILPFTQSYRKIGNVKKDWKWNYTRRTEMKMFRAKAQATNAILNIGGEASVGLRSPIWVIIKGFEKQLWNWQRSKFEFEFYNLNNNPKLTEVKLTTASWTENPKHTNMKFVARLIWKRIVKRVSKGNLQLASLHSRSNGSTSIMPMTWTIGNIFIDGQYIWKYISVFILKLGGSRPKWRQENRQEGKRLFRQIIGI